MKYKFLGKKSIVTAEYRVEEDTIVIGGLDEIMSDKLTDEERIDLLTWQLSHEHMHRAIRKYISNKYKYSRSIDKWVVGKHMPGNIDKMAKIIEKLGWKYEKN